MLTILHLYFDSLLGLLPPLFHTLFVGSFLLLLFIHVIIIVQLLFQSCFDLLNYLIWNFKCSVGIFHNIIRNGTNNGSYNKTTTDISSTKRKRVKEEVKKSTLSSKYGEIRFGALEILAVFCGTATDDDNSKEKEDDQEEEGSSTKPPLKEKEEKPSDVPVPYSFVKLASDVLYGDDVTDTIPIQWIEYNSNGKLAILDDDTDSIAIGAIIGSITNDIVEYADGTFEVPNEVIKQIEAALEKQLNDDYDMDKEQEEEATYEQRMKKRRKKAKKGIKVKMEDSQHDYDEVDDDNDDDNDDDDNDDDDNDDDDNDDDNDDDDNDDDIDNDDDDDNDDVDDDDDDDDDDYDDRQ
jgi:hypothetical protein